ncbi:hypothetical protein TH53_04635 [Pedobacter lusitanus]|uniref:Uncharacterized protein n=1 Tax=Pedobacter lusitanus TaxID=1503925 RepID=A0A0D0GM49_9SPHI|nr:hypothetical protein [Pedobacter lusitanus]KIO78302.1 hypothetical protein TH53_04635 [Pedobacter lusitanus]
MKDSKILIRQPFQEQYTIRIESEVNGVDVFVTSTVQLRYDFNVLRVENNRVEVRLIQLDNVLLEANNPMIKEVAQISQIFGRMYSELHLLLDDRGNILEVLNNELILAKWRQTKAEMEKHIGGNDDLKNAISLNDAIFNSPEKVKIAAQANEFLRVYFGQVYGVDLPVKTGFKGTNIFNTVNMDWTLSVGSSVPLPPVNGINSLTVTTSAVPTMALNSKFYEEAYNQFATKIDIKSLKTLLEQKETRIVDYQTGRIQEAEVSKVEIADEKKLYNKLIYQLKSDSGIIIKPVGDHKQSTVLAEEEKKETGSKFKFF